MANDSSIGPIVMSILRKEKAFFKNHNVPYLWGPWDQQCHEEVLRVIEDFGFAQKKYVESDTFFFYSLKNKDRELYFSTSELFLENEAMICSLN